MERCTMPKGNLQMCSRAARYRYVRETHVLQNVATDRRTSAQGDVTVAAYCAQHDRAKGHAAMLRVRPWEYSRKIDLASGVTVR